MPKQYQKLRLQNHFFQDLKKHFKKVIIINGKYFQQSFFYN